MAKMVIRQPEESPGIEWPTATVLSFDPSMTNTGWCVLRFHPGAFPRMLSYGKFGTSPTGMGTSMRDNLVRMNEVHRVARSVLRAATTLRVDIVTIELPVPSRSGSASASGSMACTAVGTAIDQYWEGAPVAIYVHPTHSKKVTTGDGKASKRMVKDFVKKWIDDPSWNGNQDIADAASAAICAMLDIVEGRLDGDYAPVLERIS